MLLADLAATSAAVAATGARLAKTQLLADTLRRLDPATPHEVHAAVAYLTGEPRQRQTGVGWAALREVPAPAAEPSLTVAGVDAACEALGAQAGPGSQAARRRLLDDLFARATEPEQRFLRGLLTGELRQGALEGVMVEAVAKAAAVPAKEVRRALMLRGVLGVVAEVALRDGPDGLRGFHLQGGRPLQPMLAQTAADVAAALARINPAAVEFKLDGARVQLHKDGDEVRVFTRTLDDVTGRAPEVVEAVAALPARSLILDGEVLALRPDGRPRPFQETASRFGSRKDVDRLRVTSPLTLFVFDLLHLDGEDALDLPAAKRHDLLAAVVPAGLRVPRTVTGDAAEAAVFLAGALAHGHEGVVVKSLDAPYEAGRRGAGWVKVKPVHTLDLVVLAVERGHGRRSGWLSNLHLGARDPDVPLGDPGAFVMLGKTFKGLTDDLLRWQTERLGALAAREEDGYVVHVRPELVVEVAFDGVQASPRYPGGVALRFARVVRYREDKRADEADTIGAVRALRAAGAQREGDAG